MYGPQLAEVYELIYGKRGKSWANEAEDITRAIRARLPGARSLLDVACGTGMHLEAFGEHFEHVEGLEISEPMRRRAVRRLPGVDVHAGDMRDFDLGRTFDVVTCLFVSISYVRSLEEMRAAARAMTRHLAPGGVLVVEPWWAPHEFIEGYVASDLVQDDGRTVARISHSTLSEGATRMDIRFLVADAGGITAFTEVDRLMLFTEDEYVTAFEDAGCPVECLDGGLIGRRYVGTRK
ncbi:class I SAM-dependent methyltransferase [Spirillospora sp. NPDC047279]|uniref:class I SAM-dependent methyltransferase n=1 Tax=Spirillospora sp. NPDC047279 TaxID=3155478 RepID=UPI0033DB5C5E